ncbi:MAG: YceI family protein [Rhodocyclaceae bacterium]|nr:YceI family protein [Rhodocyclaceae bacterium]
MKRRLGQVTAALLLAAPALAADSYTMDAAHCIPEFEFTHLGMTTQTGRFDKAHGKVILDREAHTGSIDFEVETASLNMGFGTETPDSPGYRLLEVMKFPTIRFRSNNLFFDDRNNVIAAAGKLTLLGVTKPVTVWVSRFKCAVNPMNKKMMCAANITATVKRSEFGMREFIPAISDDVKISVPVEAYKD